MDTVEINWTTISYCVIGLFALAGFFRGWWKEAITTFFLGALVLLLQMPDLAQSIIDFINQILATVWGWLPESIQGFLTNTFDITSLQIDASSGQTWLVILILMIGLSMLLAFLLLPNQIRTSKNYAAYAVRPMGSFLGGLLGGLNGFLIINLIKEYLIGTNLPPGDLQEPATEVAIAGGQTVGIASSGVDFAVTDLPNSVQICNFGNLCDIVPWVVIGFGVILLILVIWSAIRRQLRGYKKMEIQNKKENEFIIVYIPVDQNKK